MKKKEDKEREREKEKRRIMTSFFFANKLLFIGNHILGCRFRFCYQQRGQGRHHHRMARCGLIHQAEGEQY